MKARLAKRKPGFWERTKESWKSMKLWDAEELNKLDWVISAVCVWGFDADGKPVVSDV